MFAKPEWFSQSVNLLIIQSKHFFTLVNCFCLLHLINVFIWSAFGFLYCFIILFLRGYGLFILFFYWENLVKSVSM